MRIPPKPLQNDPMLPLIRHQIPHILLPLLIIHPALHIRQLPRHQIMLAQRLRMHQRQIKPHPVRRRRTIPRAGIELGGIDGMRHGARDAVVMGIDNRLAAAKDIPGHLVQQQHQRQRRFFILPAPLTLRGGELA